MKKFISIFLVLCMMATLLPTVAFASEGDAATVDPIVADFTTLKLVAESSTKNVLHLTGQVATATGFSIVPEKTTGMKAYVDRTNDGLEAQLWYGSSVTSGYVWPDKTNNNVMLTISVNADAAGYYSPEVVFSKHDFSGDFAVYINKQYAGEINANANGVTKCEPEPTGLNTVYLNAGANEVSFKVIRHYLRSGKTTLDGTWLYVDKLTLTPCEDLSDPVNLTYTFPEKVVAGESAEFTISANINEALKKFNGTYNEDGSAMERNLSVESENGTFNITEQTANVVKGTFTATAGGAATITATANVNGKIYTKDINVTVTSDEDEEVDVQDTITMSVSGTEGKVTVDGAVQNSATATYNRNVGDTVTVVAEDIEGKIFRGWLRGGANGTVVWLDNEYTFTAATNIALFAKYTDAPAENAKVKEYYDWNGEFLADEEPASETLSKYGFEFSEWLSNEVGKITRYVADYEADNTYTITKPDGVTADIADLNSVLHETKITLTNETPVSWYVNGKLAAYGTSYTFYATEKADITIDDKVQEGPIVNLTNPDGDTYILEYNANGKTVIEKGIIFGEGTPSVTSCSYKVISQRNDAFGKLMTKNNTDYTTVRGYIIYKYGDTHRVVYADIAE